VCWFKFCSKLWSLDVSEWATPHPAVLMSLMYVCICVYVSVCLVGATGVVVDSGWVPVGHWSASVVDPSDPDCSESACSSLCRPSNHRCRTVQTEGSCCVLLITAVNCHFMLFCGLVLCGLRWYSQSSGLHSLLSQHEYTDCVSSFRTRYYYVVVVWICTVLRRFCGWFIVKNWSYV